MRTQSDFDRDIDRIGVLIAFLSIVVSAFIIPVKDFTMIFPFEMGIFFGGYSLHRYSRRRKYVAINPWSVPKLAHGVYRVYWKFGGVSWVAVGSAHDGSRWMAPCNWTFNPSDQASFLASPDHWTWVEHAELIEEANSKHEYEIRHGLVRRKRRESGDENETETKI